MDQLYEEKVPAPSVPYELVQEGEIVAEAELGWEEAQVAVLAPYQEAHHDAFGEEGWTVFQLQDVRDDPTELLRQLQNGR
jgi:hypothetical protein